MTGKKAKRRSQAPPFWPVERKEYKWVQKTKAGPHPTDESFPLGVFLRDVLGRAKNLREVRYVLNQGSIKVDGRVVKDPRMSVGLMDVIEEVPTNTYYRLVPDEASPLSPLTISEEESHIKPARIKTKKTIPGGSTQLGLEDGKSFVLGREEAEAKPWDTALVDLDENSIYDFIPMEADVLGLVTGGKGVGTLGKIVDITKADPLSPHMVTIEAEGGGRSRTVRKYVFPIGTEEPVVKTHQEE